MKIIVTGGLGYLGSHVVHRLLGEGHEVITLDRMIPGMGKTRALMPGEGYMHADILGNLDAVAGVLKEASTVLHLAALIDAPQSVQKPELYYKVNFIGTLNVLELATQLGARNFLFASSAAVYGADCTSPLSEDMATPTPENPYGGSKLFGEALVTDVCRARGMLSASLRLFNLVGVDPEVGVAPQNKGLFSLAVDAMRGNRDLAIFGQDHPTPDGTCVRDFVYVGDVARAFSQALYHLVTQASPLLINVGTGQGLSVGQVLTAARALRSDFKIIYAQKRAGEVPISIANMDRTHAILNWKASPLGIATYLGQEYTVKLNV